MRHMETLWLAVGMAATGAALTIIGALSGSVPMALVGIALAVSPGIAWVLWVLILLLLGSSKTRV